MKYIIYLLAAMYIIGGIAFIKFFLIDNKNEKIDINDIKKSVVIIVPEQQLISYKNNPKGLFKDYKNSGIGAGFFISTDGKIQTVNHIVENKDINYKVLYDDKEYNSKIISRNSEKDLATLKIDLDKNTSFPVIQVENNNKLTNGEKTISFGIDINNIEVIYNTGVLINKKNKLDNISNLFEISNTLSPGYSGGPIINSKGKVIGINYAIINGKNYGISF